MGGDIFEGCLVGGDLTSQSLRIIHRSCQGVENPRVHSVISDCTICQRFLQSIIISYDLLSVIIDPALLSDAACHTGT